MLTKSEVKIKVTSGGEFKILTSAGSQDYIGEYMETNKGLSYAGRNFFKPGPLLEKIQKNNKKQPSYNKNVKKFDIIQGEIKKFLRNTQPIPTTKIYPTENNYNAGVLMRYFSKRINSTTYKEINQEVYNSIKSKEGKYDHNLNEVGQIRWSLIGNVFQQNALALEKTERKHKNISYLFPILNEFQKPTLEPQENLYTEGEELYKSDGTEYIGSYHLHPTQGPMEGAYHTDVPHPKLYYINQLPSPQNMDYEDFLDTLKPPTISAGLEAPEIPIRDTLAGTYNCGATWGQPIQGYIGLTNEDGLVPLSTACIDPLDGTGTYNRITHGDDALFTCQQECEGATSPLNVGCLLPFDPNFCSECNIHNTESCADNYLNNFEQIEDSDHFTCFCGYYELVPYYSVGCCTGEISYS